MSLKYKRVLLKLSGESLMGSQGFGIDNNVLEFFSEEIQKAYKTGVELGIVIGGGNIYRGLSATSQGIDRATGDYMGMLSTVINSLALQNAIEKRGIYTRLMSAINMEAIAEPDIRRRAIRHLEKKRIVIFGAGTGHPYFSTDTAASLRAVEIKADVLIKGTKDLHRLTAIPGVGRKTAKRLVLELRDKVPALLAREEGEEAGPGGRRAPAPTAAGKKADILSALENLGYARRVVEKPVDRALRAAPDAPIEALLKEVLRIL